MAWIPFRAYVARITELYWRGQGSVPDASKFYIMLTNSSTFTDTATMLEVVKEEVAASAANAYTRKQYAPAVGAWDAAQSRYELPLTTGIFTAGASGSIQYDRAVIIRDGTATANRAVQTIDASNNKLIFSLSDGAHGIANNDRVVVTADAGGTVPPELLNSGSPRYLYARNVIDTGSERSLQLSLTSGGSVIDFSAGSGTIRVRWANGEPEVYDVYTSRTIAAGGTDNVSFANNFGGSSADVAAA